jgi:hypothetical protein
LALAFNHLSFPQIPEEPKKVLPHLSRAPAEPIARPTRNIAAARHPSATPPLCLTAMQNRFPRHPAAILSPPTVAIISPRTPQPPGEPNNFNRHKIENASAQDLKDICKGSVEVFARIKDVFESSTDVFARMKDVFKSSIDVFARMKDVCKSSIDVFARMKDVCKSSIDVSARIKDVFESSADVLGPMEDGLQSSKDVFSRVKEAR